LKPLILLCIICGLFPLRGDSQNCLWANESNSNNLSCQNVVTDIHADLFGNIIEIGQFNDSIQFGTFMLHNGNNMLNPGAYIVKYSTSGKVLWAQCSNSDSYNSIAYNSVSSDSVGNIYITGYASDTLYFNSSKFLASGFFLLKLDSSSNVMWVKTASTGSQSWGKSITIDCNGYPIVTGIYDEILTLDSIHLPLGSAGTSYLFTAKFGPNGDIIWAKGATFTGGSNYIQPCISSDLLNNIYVAGIFSDTIHLGSFKLGSWAWNNRNIFLAKYDPLGNIMWATSAYLPSSASTITDVTGEMMGMTTDAGNNIYLTGAYTGSFVFGKNSINNGTGQGTAFLVKYNSSGKALWAKSATPSTSPFDQTYGNSISADKWGHLYWSGTTYTQSITFNGYSLGSGNNGYSFFMKLDTSANVQCGALLKTPSNYYGGYAAADPIGPNGYFGSILESTENIGGFILSGHGSSWSFLSKWTCDSNCKLPISLTGPNAICPGQNASFISVNGNSYVWSNGSISDSTTFYPKTTTTYTLYACNGICSADTIFTVNIYNYPQIFACCDTNIISGQSVQLVASGGVKYSWSPLPGLSCNNCPTPIAMPTTSTTYTLTVLNDSGCAATRTITIDVDCGTIFVPKAFSPNNDGQNDILYVHGNCIKNMIFLIFDRWGNKVFESSNTTIGWDGTYKSQPMNAGNYVYLLNATMYDGTTTERHGNVTLIR